MCGVCGFTMEMMTYKQSNGGCREDAVQNGFYTFCVRCGPEKRAIISLSATMIEWRVRDKPQIHSMSTECKHNSCSGAGTSCPLHQSI